MDDECPPKRLRQEDTFQIFQCKDDDLSLRFSSSFPARKLLLVELPPEVLECVVNGEDLQIKGSDQGPDAVLCTSNKTFSIKKVETSNSVFLVPPSSTTAFEVETMNSHYYEVRIQS